MHVIDVLQFIYLFHCLIFGLCWAKCQIKSMSTLHVCVFDERIYNISNVNQKFQILLFEE